MKPRNSIETAIEAANGRVERVRIEMICPRFSEQMQKYKIDYDAKIQSIYIISPQNSNCSYRYNVLDFERFMNKRAKIIVLSQEEFEAEVSQEQEKNAMLKKLRNFTFKSFLEENGLQSIEELNIEYKDTCYTLRPVKPEYFDIGMKKGSIGKVYMESEEKPTFEMNLTEVADLVKDGLATVKFKK